MNKCPSCSAERRYEGVMCPARKLCPCESRTCGRKGCEAVAIGVEFQMPIRAGKEPSLPKKSNVDASFFCEPHAPPDFPTDIRRMEDEETRPGRVRKHADNVDPAWTGELPPASSMSTVLMECWKCKNKHLMKDRRLHNGTMSRCPKCGDDVYTPA